MGNLEDYLQKIQPPVSAQDITSCWKSVLGVTLGLVRIHNSPVPDSLKSGVEGPKVLQGYVARAR